MEVRALRAADARAAARVLAAAFRDDPFWLAVGPRLRLHRRIVTALTNRVELAAAVRRPDPAYVAVAQERPQGVALLSDGGGSRGAWTALHAWALSVGGARTVHRAREVGQAVGAARPREPHLYLASLAVTPAHQRHGLGAALMGRVLEDAERRRLPLALETMREENLAFYERFGFVVKSHTRLLEELDVWFMSRPRSG